MLLGGYRIAGNFEGENICEFHVFVAIHESFLRKEWCPLVWEKQAICESFLCKNCIFHQLQKFSLSKVFRYTVLSRQVMAIVFACRRGLMVTRKLSELWKWFHATASEQKHVIQFNAHNDE